MSHSDAEHHLSAPVPARWLPPAGQADAPRVRAVGHDRPHQRPGRAHAVMLRVSETEYADVAEAAREAGLTPSGYAAEATLAAARAGDAPAREPLRLALAELVTARVEVTRLVSLLVELTPAGRPLTPDGPDRETVAATLAVVDRAAAAVVRGLP